VNSEQTKLARMLADMDRCIAELRADLQALEDRRRDIDEALTVQIHGAATLDAKYFAFDADGQNYCLRVVGGTPAGEDCSVYPLQPLPDTQTGGGIE